MSRAKTLTGQIGAEAAILEPTKRGYVVSDMPNHNKGFDVDCQSPKGCKFRVEVKTSSSKDTQIPIQLHHVEGNLNPDRFYVLVKKLDDAPFFDYYILTHELDSGMGGNIDRVSGQKVVDNGQFARLILKDKLDQI